MNSTFMRIELRPLLEPHDWTTNRRGELRLQPNQRRRCDGSWVVLGIPHGYRRRGKVEPVELGAIVAMPPLGVPPGRWCATRGRDCAQELFHMRDVARDWVAS